ncbi:MAG: hypothetical protein N3F09_06165 [Bacteroidia bacterium]|nr:hypothetical protein [Bacteroidia bacterium]
MKRNIILTSVLALSVFCACNSEDSKQVNNDIKSDTSAATFYEPSKFDTINQNPELIDEHQPLYLAQCSEPFMAAYFFKNKIRLMFPDGNDSIINLEKNIDWNKNFELKQKTVNGKQVELFVYNELCLHPGSGEKWDKKIKFVVDKNTYQGCVKKLNP